MSTDDFLKFMNTVKALYSDKFPKLSKEVLDVWYECLADLNVETLREALMNYVKSSDYPPTVAALRREYDSIAREKKRSEMELKRLYEMTIAFYPSAKSTKGAYEAWSILNNTGTIKDRMDKARRILNHVCVFVRRCEEDGVDNIPTLEDFLRGVDPDELFG